MIRSLHDACRVDVVTCSSTIVLCMRRYITEESSLSCPQNLRGHPNNHASVNCNRRIHHNLSKRTLTAIAPSKSADPLSRQGANLGGWTEEEKRHKELWWMVSHRRRKRQLPWRSGDWGILKLFPVRLFFVLFCVLFAVCVRGTKEPHNDNDVLYDIALGL